MLVQEFAQNVKTDIYQKKVKENVLLVLQEPMKMIIKNAKNAKSVIIQMQDPVNVPYALMVIYPKKVRQIVLLAQQELMKMNIKNV